MSRARVLLARAHEAFGLGIMNKMRILLWIHHVLDPNAGDPGVTLRLADELNALWHETEILSFSDMQQKQEGVRSQLAFPWFVAKRLREMACNYDVLDLSSGDGWLFEWLYPDNPLVVGAQSGLEEYAVNELGVRRHRAHVVDKGITDNYLNLPLVPRSGGGLCIALVGSYIDRKIHAVPGLLSRLLQRHIDGM